jgi:hypothetical protein
MKRRSVPGPCLRPGETAMYNGSIYPLASLFPVLCRRVRLPATLKACKPS